MFAQPPPIRSSFAPRPSSLVPSYYNRDSHLVRTTTNDTLPIKQPSNLTKSVSATSNPDQPDHPTFLPRDANVTSLSLIIRARTGMTRQMYNAAAAAPSRTFTTWGAIEGPYGGHESLSSYGTVILFAGGVGITHCIGYIRHLLQQYQAGTTSTRKILLVWSVPTTESLEWVRAWMDTILRMECRREVLRIQLFVTKPRHRGEVVSSTGSVQMFPGRCNPDTILKREVPERIGAMGVTVCGPGAFADSVRAACRGVVREVQLDFVEEAFTY
jgi:predicted ferric reductase